MAPSAQTNGSGPIGLLVVHGIGTQNPGSTIRGVLRGLRRAYGDAITVDWVTEHEHAIVGGLARPVHLIEVYWADLLHGPLVQDTFDFRRVYEVAWFPSLNARSGLLDPAIVPPGRVRRWTTVLAFLSPILSMAVNGASLVAQFVSLPRRASKSDPAETATGRPRTWVDDAMDQTVADVFNYVDGRRGSFPQTTERTRRIGEQVQAIDERFERARQRAVDAGCTELQVVAHSLGTVIAFRSLHRDAGRSDNGSSTVTHLYTIGSPLEKFRFFWTPLVDATAQDAPPAPATAPTFAWDNFYSPLDLVSGKLRGYPGWPAPANHRVPQLGGLMSSHVAYDANPTFLTALGNGLGGPAPTVATSRAQRWKRGAITVLQNLALPIAIVLLAALGFGLLLTMAWILSSIIAVGLRAVGLDGAADITRNVILGLVAFGGTVAAVIGGRVDAKVAHAKHWAPAREIPGDVPAVTSPNV